MVRSSPPSRWAAGSGARTRAGSGMGTSPGSRCPRCSSNWTAAPRRSRGAAVLYDLDTACWAPSVWDLTHLLNRAGTGQNTGYTAAELLDLSPITAVEVEAALELRKVAAEVARAHREYAALAATPATVRAAA